MNDNIYKSLKKIQDNLDKLEDRHTKLTQHLDAIKEAHARYSEAVDILPRGVETAKAMAKLNAVESYITDCLEHFVTIMVDNSEAWYDNISEDSVSLIDELAQIEAEPEDDMDTITIDDESVEMIEQILMLIENNEDAKAVFKELITLLNITSEWKKNQ